MNLEDAQLKAIDHLGDREYANITIGPVVIRVIRTASRHRNTSFRFVYYTDFGLEYIYTDRAKELLATHPG